MKRRKIDHILKSFQDLIIDHNRLREALATVNHAMTDGMDVRKRGHSLDPCTWRHQPAKHVIDRLTMIMTGEEILDAGVQVMAQPPGKRNTSIHLLSGGEKALTAISLVFSLFQLNPAPFCLLDEVDAPLDESNTHRFCKMVQDMSGESQFLFISHNKITMEMASQLIGITMPEAGVSRVVAVDIAEAVELASTQAQARAAA
jgi:ABC-type dipeptide/oligopeptide/nickel transport system ATPase subunit